MNFQIVIEIEVERVSGKFASREELLELLVEELQNSDPGGIETDDGAEYTVEYVAVDELPKERS